MMRRPLLRSSVVALLALAACEGKDAHGVGPNGGSAFTKYIAVGTSISMGMQSAGVTATSQVEAWPALLARQAGATFQIPYLRTPGCTPPLIAPLQLGRLLSGASALAGDSTCSGTLGSYTPPLNNLALSGATAWAALNLTPRLVTAPTSTFSAADRGRYAAVLGTTQSQVTAMLIAAPTIVSVELGANELLGAATSGLLIAATSYTQATPWTYVPATVFGPVYASIADSVKVSKARAILFTVPKVTNMVSMRAGSELAADRAAFATFGIAVAASCDGSANLVFTGSVVPALVARAQLTGALQTLSCDDVPGAADGVLTPADVATLNGAADQMNAQITALAKANGWAVVDMNTVLGTIVAARPAYSVAAQLGCLNPYGQYISLDGVHPSLAGQQLLANAAAQAVNATYGFAIPTQPVTPLPPAQVCLGGATAASY